MSDAHEKKQISLKQDRVHQAWKGDKAWRKERNRNKGEAGAPPIGTK